MSRYKLQYRSNYVIDTETHESLIDTHPRYLEWLADGNTPDPADPIIPPPRMLSKLTITDRIIALGKLGQVQLVLGQNAEANARWQAAVEIRADDEQVIAMLGAAGLTESEIAEVLA